MITRLWVFSFSVIGLLFMNLLIWNICCCGNESIVKEANWLLAQCFIPFNFDDDKHG